MWRLWSSLSSPCLQGAAAFSDVLWSWGRSKTNPVRVSAFVLFKWLDFCTQLSDAWQGWFCQMHKITLLTQQVTVPSTQLCLGNPVCAHSYSALISVPRTTVPGAGPSPSTQCLGSDCKCTVRFPLHLVINLKLVRCWFPKLISYCTYEMELALLLSPCSASRQCLVSLGTTSASKPALLFHSWPHWAKHLQWAHAAPVDQPVCWRWASR